MKSEEEQTIELLNALKEVFLINDHDDVLEESIDKMLKAGTVFWRDVKKVTNQNTFRQYLDISGVPEVTRTLFYKNIQRIRNLADIFPNKALLWRALYLGAVYQALLDNADLEKIVNK